MGSRICPPLFIVLLLFFSSSVMSTQTPLPELGIPTDIDREQAGKAIKSLIEYMEKSTAIPARELDTEALAAALGKDPEVLFSWVHANTSLVPYRGTLRGTRGVMLDRLGNSLDRSLLLAALFKAHGIKTRLMRGKLDKELAGNLLAETMVDSPAQSITAPGLDKDTFKKIMTEQAGIDRAVVDSYISALNRSNSDNLTSAQNTTGQVGAELLTRTLSTAVGSPDSRMQSETTARIEDLQDHW